MKVNDRYRINKPDVILESFDDEVVLVNLASGNYFSIDALGAEIWAMAQAGFTVREMTAHLAGVYHGALEDIEAAVTGFIGNLLSENLIVPDPAAPSPKDGMNRALTEERKTFTPPVLHKYTDMQELLLIDPIHEVDETGWPNIPSAVAGPDSGAQES